METIKERAWEKYPEVIKHHNLATIDINEKKRKMYIEIATEQKSIDIALLKSKLKSIMIIAQDPTMHQERKEMEILAMIQMVMEE